MSYRLPPLNGLRAFEAAGRHLSFKHAANELAVTPGAIGQQVRALERTLSVALFRRLPRSLVLTAKGEAYLAAIGPAFRMISAATDAVSPALSGRRLRVGIAARLLASASPAIAALRQDKRSKRVAEVIATDDMAALIEGRVDALLRKPGGRYPGFHAERIAIRTGGDGREAADLVTVPGLAGCREHRALVKLLRS